MNDDDYYQKLLADLEKKMSISIDKLIDNFQGLRTGTASVQMLSNIVVEAYGDKVVLSKLGNITVADSKTITVQLWDTSLSKAVEKAIHGTLSINCNVDGNVLRVTLPPITGDRRAKLAKVAKGLAEDARISIRNIRKIGMNTIKSWKKDSKISEDEAEKISANIQEITGKFIALVGTEFDKKEIEILGNS